MNPIDPDLDKYLERLMMVEESSWESRSCPLIDYAQIVTAICWVLATKDQLGCDCEETE